MTQIGENLADISEYIKIALFNHLNKMKVQDLRKIVLDRIKPFMVSRKPKSYIIALINNNFELFSDILTINEAIKELIDRSLDPLTNKNNEIYIPFQKGLLKIIKNGKKYILKSQTNELLFEGSKLKQKIFN